jgi:acylphosphatase
MTDQRERLHAIITGRVQRVNFRNATRHQARRLGLSGWVRNTRDGCVELLAEGPRSDLEKLLAFLHVGPPGAVVQQVHPEWLPPGGEFTSFEIKW